MRLRSSQRLDLQPIDQPDPQQHALEERRPAAISAAGRGSASAVIRLSSVQSSTNCTNDCRSSCCAGMPSTIARRGVGASRTVPVWQTAQFNPT